LALVSTTSILSVTTPLTTCKTDAVVLPPAQGDPALDTLRRVDPQRVLLGRLRA